jgi:pimeloyl-ACP methyl ester carboxylesterase
MYQTVLSADRRTQRHRGQRVRLQVHLVVGVGLFCSAIGAVHGEALRLQECRLESAATGGSVAARCGWYGVPENRADPHSGKLQLHVAVIPAMRLEPAADPLFVLSGGPGQAASDFYLSMAPAFARIRRDRDIVVIDQRGTGKSQRLDCDFPEESDFTLVGPRQLDELARACLAALKADPRFYTTSVAVRDLDEVRAALHYPSINLYGISYGTRVAQHYMRRYPQRVRAAILDGVVPAEVALGPDVAIEAQRALDTAFARCAKDDRCGHRFPNLAGSFQALRTRLEKTPLPLSLPDPLNAELTTSALGAAQLSAAVRLLSYSDETLSTLPLLIHEAEIGRRPEPLAAQYLMIKRNTDQQIAYGMHFAVVCSEDAPRWAHESVSDEALAQTYIGTAFMAGMKTICERWPRGPVDDEFGAPLRSDAAVLILSGGNDPVTPKRYGEQILRGLPNAKHLVLDGQGHGQLASGCVPRVAAEFIAEGSAKALHDECVKAIAAAPFMLSRTATAP